MAKTSEPKRMGRPRFEPTEEMRERVEIMMGAGFNEEDAARALKIAPNTLREHFLEELHTGRAIRRGEIACEMYHLAKSKNVSAMKAYLAMGELPPMAEMPKEKPLGKKAAAEIAGRNPDTATSMGSLMAARSQVAPTNGSSPH